MLLEVRDSSYLGLISIFRPGKEGFSIKSLFGEEKWDFRVLIDVSSPRRRCKSSNERLVLRIGEGKARLGVWGLLRRGHTHLGEPRDKE